MQNFADFRGLSEMFEVAEGTRNVAEVPDLMRRNPSLMCWARWRGLPNEMAAGGMPLAPSHTGARLSLMAYAATNDQLPAVQCILNLSRTLEYRGPWYLSYDGEMCGEVGSEARDVSPDGRGFTGRHHLGGAPLCVLPVEWCRMRCCTYGTPPLAVSECILSLEDTTLMQRNKKQATAPILLCSGVCLAWK